jgi:hypothetical protein
VASSPLLNNGDNCQPVTSRGLAILEPTSRVELDLECSSTESNVGLAGDHKQSTPPCESPPPHTVSLRPQSVEILVTETQQPPMAPVTVETATDESNVSKHHSCREFTFAAIDDLYHPGTSAGYMLIAFARPAPSQKCLLRISWALLCLTGQKTRACEGGKGSSIHGVDFGETKIDWLFGQSIIISYT